MDLSALGTAIATLLVAAGGTVAWWENRKAKAAKMEAEVARSGAERTVADSEHTLYKLLVERLNRLEASLAKVEQDLDAERRRGRELETHIYHLENLMRRAGMDPPERKFVIG
jgi:uncharacterized protein HemX